MGERRELNPRMVDSQSTALIHLATSARYAQRAPRPSFSFTVIKPIKQLIYLCILAPNSNEIILCLIINEGARLTTPLPLIN